MRIAQRADKEIPWGGVAFEASVGTTWGRQASCRVLTEQSRAQGSSIESLGVSDPHEIDKIAISGAGSTVALSVDHCGVFVSDVIDQGVDPV